MPTKQRYSFCGGLSIARYDASMASLENQIKQQAHSLGFELVGIAKAGPADGFERLRDWLEQGFAGDMGYMHRHEEARRHPSSILPAVRSVVMVGMNYKPAQAADAAHSGAHGRVARYALGEDYHRVLRQRLNQLLECLQREVPDCRGRPITSERPAKRRLILSFWIDCPSVCWNITGQ